MVCEVVKVDIQLDAGEALDRAEPRLLFGQQLGSLLSSLRHFLCCGVVCCAAALPVTGTRSVLALLTSLDLYQWLGRCLGSGINQEKPMRNQPSATVSVPESRPRWSVSLHITHDVCRHLNIVGYYIVFILLIVGGGNILFSLLPESLVVHVELVAVAASAGRFKAHHLNGRRGRRRRAKTKLCRGAHFNAPAALHHHDHQQ